VGMYYHVWFVTKYRKNALEGKIEKFVKDMLKECGMRHNYKISELETNKDHVHMLVEAESTKELSTIVRVLKAVSAREILRSPHYRVGNIQHFWARRYGCKEIDENEIGNIREYIRNQK
jgi:putative transposase